MTTKVEQELITAAKFRGRQEDRQDYLGALVRKLEKVSDDVFNDLSDEAASWYDAAALAINKKNDIPDFESVLPNTANGASDETESPSGQPGLEDPVEAAAPDEDFTDETVEPEEPELVETDPAETDPGPDAEPPEAEKPKRGPGRPKKVKKEKTNTYKVLKKATPDRYDSVTGEKDRFGVVKGTKTSDAVAMYARGCTMQELEEVIGGRHRNILKTLQKRGHKVEKEPGGIWRVTHKDDLGKGK